MGYSATKKALDTLKALVPGNANGTNCWRKGKVDYFYEIGDEQTDGSIVGEVWRSDNSLAFFVGYFKISADGVISKFPGLS
jgi:hypothetical protein